MTSRRIPLVTNASRDYILLTQALDIFEPAIFGGKNKSERALKLAQVQYGESPCIMDDIVSDKNIFRCRSKRFVKSFLDDNDLKNGDFIVIKKVAPYTYKILKG